MIEDNIQVNEKTDADWHDERTWDASRLGARLASDPCQVAGHLEDSLQGANWKLDRWRLLAAEAAENQGLDEPQRQLAFDLLGVPRELRRGTSRVPAGHDVAGLKALCAREIKRLETRVVLELEGRDKRARARARLGLPVTANDTVTRRIKSNESRAHKRFVWALVTLSPCHLVTLSPYHLVTLSPSAVTLSPSAVTLSPSAVTLSRARRSLLRPGC
jgi:hypothetical protein